MAQKNQTSNVAEDMGYVDYKDLGLLRKHTTRYAKIKPRKYTKTSLRNQRALARAIKRARFMALLQYVR